MTQHADVVVVGGGQAGLAAGYHLRRQSLDVVILDAEAAPGGSWQHMWDSLHLFSPAEHSSLPGRLMPAQPGETYPGAGHVVDYLAGPCSMSPPPAAAPWTPATPTPAGSPPSATSWPCRPSAQPATPDS